ncbi:MAG: DUF3987 domain-containing protein, partial [Mycobacterium sp.]
MGEAFDRICAAFEQHGLAVVHRGDGQASAQAPGHSPADRSVSIKSVDGMVLMHCHAGEDKHDVLAAVGLQMRDLFDNRRDLRHEYSDGRIVVRSYTTPGKKAFTQRGNKTGTALYHSDRIGEASTVHVVEGEKDVHAVEAAGGTAVCSPLGAGKADRFDWSPLHGKDVEIVADRDKPGRDHAEDIAAILKGKAKIRVVEPAIGKDASDHIAAGRSLDDFVPIAATTEAADETVRTVPWPTLSDAALHGAAGKTVNLVAPHTEADPAAILVQLLATFGATLGPEPHFVAGNDRHQAIIHPLVVGRTNDGANGTSLSVVEAIRRRALPWFDEFTTSGLSTAEGLIELVRDPSGDPNDKDYDPGVADKRLLVKESEYKSVLVRSRREGNTLGQTLREAFDCRTLRTLARKHNKLTATAPHIVVIGHVTPREFRNTIEDSDLSGGSVNRLLICASRRSRLHSRLGNLPEKVLTAAAKLFEDAYRSAVQRGELKFTDQFWRVWDCAYRELNRDRPDSRATDATARAVTMVLRLSLLYALIDRKDAIDAEHLDAALALWAYAEHSAKWLFSTHELEVQGESAGGLANFILEGGEAGRTRTEISRDYFKRNKSAEEINAELVPLVHDGVVIEIKDETGPRP